MKIKLIGYGEIGKAVEKLYIERGHNVIVHDPVLGHFVNKEESFDILVVCIPYTDSFVNEILKHLQGVQMCIVHSTVPIGTVENIPDAIHIPIEGKHPNLYKALKLWKPTVGIDNDNIFGSMYNDFVYSIWGADYDMATTRETEACKLLSTLLYGVNIEFMRYANDVLKGNYMVFNRYNDSYNELYKALRIPASRYILHPPKGDIGGHCIVPNAKLLPDNIFTHIVKNKYKYKWDGE